MANTKSALKMIHVAERRHRRNKPVRSGLKTYINKAERLILEDKADAARAAVAQAVSALDRAAQKGILHQNNAARHKSRLMKKLNDLVSRLAASPTTEPATAPPAAS